MRVAARAATAIAARIVFATARSRRPRKRDWIGTAAFHFRAASSARRVSRSSAGAERVSASRVFASSGAGDATESFARASARALAPARASARTVWPSTVSRTSSCLA